MAGLPAELPVGEGEEYYYDSDEEEENLSQVSFDSDDDEDGTGYRTMDLKIIGSHGYWAIFISGLVITLASVTHILMGIM